MKKAVIGAVAAITAIAPTPLLAASWEEAHASPSTVVTTPPVPTRPQRAYEAPPVQQAPPVHQAPPTHEAPPVIRTHEAPSVKEEPPVTQAPTHTVRTPITQEPRVPTQAPIATQAQTPKVIPPATAGPTKVMGGTPPGAVIPSTAVTPVHPHVASPVHVTPPPKGPIASPGAIEAAKKARPVVIEPGRPPAPPIQVNFNLQVQNVITTKNANIDVVNVGNQVVARPPHWDYVDYDDYHRPILYNPINEALTFRYFYDGDYREAYIPVGGRIVLNITIVGIFAFTAVGQDYITVGNFQGGGWIPPVGWVGPRPTRGRRRPRRRCGRT